MNSKKLFYGLVGILVLLTAVGIGGAVMGDRQLKQKSDKLIKLKTESNTIDQQQIVLVQAKKDVAKYADLKNIVKAIVPQDKDQARTVREIVNIANESKVRIASITFPTSTLGQVTPKSTGSTSESSSSSSSSSTPAQPKSTTPPTTQVKPVEGISRVYQMDVTIQSEPAPIPYTNLLTFLQKLENNRRTAQVSSLTVQPDGNDRSRITFNLILNVYIKP